MRTAERNSHDTFVILVDLLSKGASIPDEQQDIQLHRTVNQPASGSLKPFSDNGLRPPGLPRQPSRQIDNHRNIVGPFNLSTQNVVCNSDRLPMAFCLDNFKKRLKTSSVNLAKICRTGGKKSDNIFPMDDCFFAFGAELFSEPPPSQQLDIRKFQATDWRSEEPTHRDGQSILRANPKNISGNL